MEFKDRSPQYPGRVRLTPVSGQNNVYDMTLEDGAGTTTYPAGTPLNKQTFDQFREDLLDLMARSFLKNIQRRKNIERKRRNG